MDRLAKAGTKQGDIKGFLFGAIDALDKRSRPSLAAVEKDDRADDERRSFQARLERTRSAAAAIYETGSPLGPSLDDAMRGEVARAAAISDEFAARLANEAT